MTDPQYEVTTAEEAIETIDELITAAEPCLTDEELQGFGAVIAFLESSVFVDRDVLEELVDVANGQLETMVPNGPYDEEDEAVQDLVETRDQAKDALEGSA